jgi:hypothetical protein
MARRRDPSAVKACLHALPSGAVVTTAPCRIQIPERYVERGLAEIGIDTYIYAIYALLLEDDTYAVSNCHSMLKINPFKLLKIKVGDVPYIEFHFLANSPIFHSTNVVRSNAHIFDIIDEFMFQGKIPWYMDYNDVGYLFDTAKTFAGSDVSSSLETIELLASMMARNKSNRVEYYRTSLSDDPRDSMTSPAYIPFKSVFYASTNTLNKLAGNYFQQGVVSALVTPTDHVQHLEQLIRA